MTTRTTEAGDVGTTIDAAEVRRRVRDLLAACDPATTDTTTFLGARFDAGLAWVYFPPGYGGLGADRGLQQVVESELAAAGAPAPSPRRNPIGLGMAAPTILAHGSDEQKRRYLRPMWTGEEVWCQLFSEPGAGSDLARLGARAVRDVDGWVVDGQKVWTSVADRAQWGLLLARSDPDVPKHQGMTYFICDMSAPGVEVRPLRQLTGQAEFNEVFLEGVRIPDELRLDEVGAGWKVATTTLMSERVALGGAQVPREGGMVGEAARLWRERPDLRGPGLHDRLLRLWVDCEVTRLTNERTAQQLATGSPGPEGSAVKLAYARLNQRVSRLWLEMSGEDGLRYDDWSMRKTDPDEASGRGAAYHYLRAKGNSIEGGTSEILRNIIAERVIGLPKEPRGDADTPWREIR